MRDRDHAGGAETARLPGLHTFIDAVGRSLNDDGYSAKTVRPYVYLLRAFERWLVERGRTVLDLEDEVVAFLGEVRDSGRSTRNYRAAIGHLRALLRECGVLPSEVEVECSTLDLLMHRYRLHLRLERGLMTSTIPSYAHLARRFLVHRFGDRDPDPGQLRASDIHRFMLEQARTSKRGRTEKVATVLRSFCRFLICAGEIDADLGAAVLPVRSSRWSDIPKYLDTDQVEHLLASCDSTTPCGLRNRAVLLLLARLGLRAGEIVALTLDDIDWRTGDVAVLGKGRVRDRLPLVEEVGEALAADLQRGRPQSESRRVFLRSRAPHRGLAHPSTVSTLVRRALRRAGLEPPRKGAHLLRHGLATNMLRRGASMAEIGQLLRHRSAAATEVYAKVDIGGLRDLARPWPTTWSTP